MDASVTSRGGDVAGGCVYLHRNRGSCYLKIHLIASFRGVAKCQALHLVLGASWLPEESRRYLIYRFIHIFTCLLYSEVSKVTVLIKLPSEFCKN